MSHYLESLAGKARRAECHRNDRSMAEGLAIGVRDAQRHTSNHRLQFARTLDEAFRTPRYADPFEHHLRPSMWVRLRRWARRWIR